MWFCRVSCRSCLLASGEGRFQATASPSSARVPTSLCRGLRSTIFRSPQTPHFDLPIPALSPAAIPASPANVSKSLPSAARQRPRDVRCSVVPCLLTKYRCPLQNSGWTALSVFPLAAQHEHVIHARFPILASHPTSYPRCCPARPWHGWCRERNRGDCCTLHSICSRPSSDDRRVTFRLQTSEKEGQKIK